MSPVLRIALADDQALVRHGLRALLQGLGGLEVAIEAEDGELLLAALQRTRVDVIVADVRMPRRSGIDVVQVLRARGDYTPTILVTTFDDPALLAGRRAGRRSGLPAEGRCPGRAERRHPARRQR